MRQALLLIHGRLWAKYLIDTEDEEATTQLTAGLERSLQRANDTTFGPKDHHEVDEAGILTRFLFRNEGSESMVLLSLNEAGEITDKPADIARRVLMVPDDAIAELDVKRAIQKSDEEENLDVEVTES